MSFSCTRTETAFDHKIWVIPDNINRKIFTSNKFYGKKSDHSNSLIVISWGLFDA